uniref:Putative large secreted protein n=1 Tax=uncultured bacterium NM_1663 TaxID=1630017 RepID=A0A0E3M3G0_9BACT|nr:putative large secreted protein [uncultured bacterium NM_1663]
MRQVDLTVFDPASGMMQPVTVARYLYDRAGYLRAAWDPRISPTLTTTYGYDAKGHLTSITPPGQEAWTLAYATTPRDPLNEGRLSSVSRPALPGTATTTVAYDVPLTGGSAPYQMGAANAAAWGQTDVPMSATAIFPPDRVPSNPPTNYSPAEIHYLDNQGRQVNLAEPGGRISTTEYDEDDNAVRELTPANRQRALASSNSAQRASELDTRRTFAPNGIEMTDEVGPRHAVELASGETVQARRRVHVTYDEDRTGGVEHLPTTTTVSAQIAGRPDADARTTKRTYDWALGKPKTETKDPGGLNLTETTLYDATTGLVTETRQPSEPGGGGPGTTRTTYWSAGANAANAACGGRPEWANLPCKKAPAAQPGGPPLPITRYTYNWLGQVATQTDTSGTTTRTQTFTYDGAGRELSEAISSGAGAAQPTVFTTYHPTLGLPTTTSTSDGTITRGYDSLGRVVSYTDADANISTTTYDLLSRPVTTTDGKGSQTRTYDPNTGDLTGMSISGVGALSATYDADGKLTSESYPNGLRAETSYDETGEPVRLTYTKSSDCGADCTWYADRVTSSVHGQWLTETSTLGDKRYAYDAAGRLKQVRDTPPELGCTVRDYSYDANSNRTARVRHDPGLGGECYTAGAGTRSSYSYDAADRLISDGYTYDAFGRTLKVPGRDTGAPAGVGDMTQTYFADDRIQSITQNAVTTSYTLDPNLRTRTESVAGLQPVNRTNHYADDSDSPAWTSEDSTGTHWSRNVTGIDGDLVAVQDSVTGVQFQLTNLHGDLIATAAADSSSPNLLKTSRYDEFGVPAAGTTPDRYGWLGSKRRATSQPSGSILMGQRVYLPTTGRFLQTDPVEGGSSNTYDYADADPVNRLDLDGRHVGCRSKVHWVGSRRGSGRLNFYADWRCPKSAWPTGVSLLKVTVTIERKVRGKFNVLLKGKFEHVFTGRIEHFFRGQNRDLKIGGWNVRCHHPGRRYKVKLIVNAILHSPTGIGVGTHHERFVNAKVGRCA